MTSIRPASGFNPLLVNWGAPDQVRTEHCSYCGEKLPTEDEDPGFVPLIMFADNGWVAEFCNACMATWFGMRSCPEPRERDDAGDDAP